MVQEKKKVLNIGQCHLVKKAGNHISVVAFLFCDKKSRKRLDKGKTGILNIIRRNYRRVFLMSIVSSKSKDYSPDYVLGKLDDAIHHVKQNIQCYCEDPLKDFTRSRKWDLDTIVRFLIQMESKSMKSELCNYFSNVKSLPTDSSLCQQRAKLSSKAFERILYLFTRSFHYEKTIKEYYLLAADGSDINIPYISDDKETIHDMGKNGECSQFHINALYDCLNHIYWNIHIDTASKKRESDALKNRIVQHDYPKKSIITADRGYEGYDLIACCNENHQKFVFRVKDKESGNSILKNCDLPEGEFDVTIQKKITRKQTNEIKMQKTKYITLSNSLKFTYLDITDDFYDIKFRVVRFPLKDGNHECLITNLDESEFTMEELKELYELRWQIETSFRKLKYTIGLSNFHSKKRRSIEQEIFARVIFYNLSNIMALNTEVKTKGRTHVLTFNFTLVVTNIRLYLRGFFKEAELIKRIKKYLVPIRPDRSYPRNVKPQSLRSFNHRSA